MKTYPGLEIPFADWKDWSLQKVLRHQAETRPEATYLSAPEEGLTLTYAQTLEAAEALATTLYANGAEYGDRVLIQAKNSSELVLSWFGAGVGGFVEVPINTAYEYDFLAHQVRTSEPRWAIVDSTFAPRFAQIKDDCAGIEKFWVIDDGDLENGLKVLRDAGWTAEPFDDLRQRRDEISIPDVVSQDLGAIFFTSGTTGPSKGVAMSHAMFYFDAVECMNLTKLTPEDTYMVTTPLFHGNAQWLAAYPALVAGAKFVLYKKFSASRWIDWVRDSGVTVTNFLGVMMDFVWKQPPRENDADNNLRCIFAAPTAGSIAGPFGERFGVEAFVECFGLTEVSMPILSPYASVGERPAGAAGLAVAEWFDVKLVDPATDIEVPVGEVGELVVRSKHPWTLSMGYYGAPEKTVEVWRNMWFHTGDALRKDEEGWFYFVDRYKDALRRRGENISSYEVEQGILAHDDVFECAVIAVPADFAGGEDEVMACIVPKREIDVQELWEFIGTKVPAFAVPRFIRFMDALPKTPSEKVQKAQLRNDAVTSDTHDREALVQTR